MRIALFLARTHGSSPLVGGLWRGLCELGHHVEEYRAGVGYDLVLVANVVTHDTGYEYPPFPAGNVPIAFIDAAEYGWATRLPGNEQAWATSFTPSAMGHDTKNRAEQEKLRRWLEGRSFPYFLREKLRALTYPAMFHGIDYPLYHLSRYDVRPNREEYLRRDLELFCWWGHSHPWRQHIEQALRDAHRKAEIGNRWDDENMPQERYFERMQAARCTVSFDGYGSSSFRLTEGLCRTALLVGPLSIEMRAPLVDGETAFFYEVESSGEEFVSTNIAERLRYLLECPEDAFEVYQRGFEHVYAHWTEKSTAAYVLDVVEKHNWNEPTPLTI
jgi:hypothetical protein